MLLQLLMLLHATYCPMASEYLILYAHKHCGQYQHTSQRYQECACACSGGSHHGIVQVDCALFLFRITVSCNVSEKCRHTSPKELKGMPVVSCGGAAGAGRCDHDVDVNKPFTLSFLCFATEQLSSSFSLNLNKVRGAAT